MIKSLSKNYYLMIVLGSANVSFGAPPLLNNTELFMRCYSQLTQSRVLFSNPLLSAVQAGTKDPIAACMEIFDRAKFDAQDRITYPNDIEAKAVLRVMHKLHVSFFSYRDIPALNGDVNEITRDIFDSETPAYYFTRALFRPNTDFSSVTTLNTHLRAIRTDLDPARGPASNRTKAETIFGTAVKFAPKGELLGVETTGLNSTHYEYTATNNALQSGDIALGSHYGGGILGSTPYLLSILTREGPFRPTGGKVLRGFGKAMFSDLLCRELPVVRYVDVAAFKDSAADISFRKTQGCVQCHASMDRAAATVRGLSYSSLGRAGVANPVYGGQFVTSFAPTLGDGTAWPVKEDANYFRRESDGVFYFRNYKGELVNTPVRGLAALGQTIASQSDLYLCAAKRYYAYFTGVDIQIDDPQNIGVLSATDKIHQRNVENLAQKLQQGQRLRDLVADILKLPEYKKSSFGADR